MSADKLPEEIVRAVHDAAAASWREGLVLLDSESHAEAERAAVDAIEVALAAILAALRERERETIERCAKIVEDRRRLVLACLGDPTRTEHFAELSNAIRALLPPEEKP